MFEQRFGESSPWSVGIEEELFVLDAGTLAPVPVPPSLFDGTRRKRELFDSLVELTTAPCPSVPEALDELRGLRAEVGQLAQDAGLRVAAAGTHPTARLADQAFVEEPALAAFAAYAGPSAHAQFCCGLHVHVGVPGADDCLARIEAILPWLPVMLAVSANSPFLAGRATGLASTRAELLTRLPRSGAPPVFPSYASWEIFAERLVRLGLADDYTRIWWDARPHPRLGTLEVRTPDQPTSLDITGAFAALIQALVATSEPGAPADRGIYAQNRWAALRFGTHAELIHPDGSRLASVPELTAELLTAVGPTAERLGSAHLLEPLERLARRSQADEQADLGRDLGLRALTAWLAQETT